MNKEVILKEIQNWVPSGSPEPQDPVLLTKLQTLTQMLIQASGIEGLRQDPFESARKRTIQLYADPIMEKLRGKVVLVTGGEGFVGSQLIDRISQFGIQRILSVDNVRGSADPRMTAYGHQGIKVTEYAIDVCDIASLA